MIVGLFPGQGLDPNVVADALAGEHPRIDEASRVLGYDLRRYIEREARRSSGNALPTDLAQPAIFVAGIIAFESASDAGTRFERFIGHSLGEYTALVAAEAISFNDGLRVVSTRARAMKRAALAADGGMAAAAGISFDTAVSICAENGVYVANDNSPKQIVFAGPRTALASAAAAVNRSGGRTVLLPVDGAFHTPAMAPAAHPLQRVLEAIDIRSPKTEVIANVTAAPYRSPGEIRKLCVRQLTETVRFRESIAYSLEHGADEFVDLGPGRVVGRLAAATTAEWKEAVRV